MAHVCRQITAGKKLRIGLLSCPSLYDSIKQETPTGTIINLFEFDERFAVFKDFIHYDYNRASDPNYLNEFQHNFDILIADPPFLSEECIAKMAQLMQNFAKDDGTTKVILC